MIKRVIRGSIFFVLLSIVFSSIDARANTITYNEKSYAKIVKLNSNKKQDKKNHREALDTLEMPDSPASKKDTIAVKAAFLTAQRAAKKCDRVADFKGTIENCMSMTSAPVAVTFAMAVSINNYSVDTVEVYQSKNPDVVQYVVGLKSKGKEKNYWAGNYNIYAKQLQLVSYHGGELGATYG